MKIRVLKPFRDLKLDRMVEAGEVYTVTKTRFKEMEERQSQTDTIYVEEVKED